jgi:RNA polymerase sigma-70 factor (ECF subfamily)
MDGDELLTAEFEANRGHLRSVAYRMLGSGAEADDAVQEAWLRLNRTDTSDVANLGGWLTTVVSRVCLDMLRSRTSRREDPLAPGEDTAPGPAEATDPAHETVIADSVGLAMLVVLEALTPPERIAFVLHDLFAVPFDDIAPIVDRSPAATRQLASRARRRVQGSDTPDAEANLARKTEVVDAFLAAARGGDFDRLLTLLDPDVVLRADAAAVEMGADAEVRGAAEVATTFAGRAKVAQPALVDGAAGLVFARGGTPQVVFDLVISDGKIVAIELLADPATLAELDLVLP